MPHTATANGPKSLGSDQLPQHPALQRRQDAPPEGASPSPMLVTAPSSGPRSSGFDRRPLQLLPLGGMSFRTSHGVSCDAAPFQGEPAAPPDGASLSPMPDTVTPRGPRNSLSFRPATTSALSESGWLQAILRRKTHPQNDVNHSGCVRAHGDVRDAHRECLRMCMQRQHAILR